MDFNQSYLKRFLIYKKKRELQRTQKTFFLYNFFTIHVRVNSDRLAALAKIKSLKNAINFSFQF